MPVDPAEQARLAALAEYGVVGMRPDDPVVGVLTGLCELAVRVTGMPHAVVSLIDDRFQHQVAAFGSEPTAGAREDALGATALAGGHDLVVVDASADSRFRDSPWVDGRLGAIRGYCGVILRNPAGLALGTLCVWDDHPQAPDAAALRALQLLARQVVDELELRLRTRELERAQARMAVSQDRLVTFARQVSHDLKAPITAILGFAELLSEMDAVAADPSATAYVERCASSGRRMRAMIDELLAFAKVGADLATSVVPLDRVMPEVLDDLGPLPADVTVRWSGPPLSGDRHQLRALLNHLVGNALNYRDPAVPTLIEVATTSVDGGVELRVTDDGPGIPADRRDDVLRPSVRLRSDVPGNGLGLAVCARIATAHGGRLRVEDGPGGVGTAIAVLFPPRPDADGPDERVRPSGPATDRRD